MAQKHCTGCQTASEDSFAMELLKGYSAQAKRWFTLAMVELAVILAIISGAIYLFSTSEFSCTELSTNSGGNANYVSESTIGAINNHGKD